MAANKADVIRLLEAELDLIEGGGYGNPAGRPSDERPMFSESLACINHWLVPGHEGGCREDCALMPWVPEQHRKDELPCHFIPLDRSGHTVHSLAGKQSQLEEAVKVWLRERIRRLRSGEETLPDAPDVKY
jgi:hypothetical protein